MFIRRIKSQNSFFFRYDLPSKISEHLYNGILYAEQVDFEKKQSMKAKSKVKG